MRFFSKTLITMIMIFAFSRVYGFLSCPQTEEEYQALLFRQGGSITSAQNRMLQLQCYEEVKRQFEHQMRNRYQSPGIGGHSPMDAPGTGNETCSHGLFKGQIVDPNRCLIGQGGEMMEKMLKAFRF
uniref:Uncharacterized protein n=1 Tax=Candidatus Kentrum sp. UNK TaxID=2126344 RepID=A0A451AQU5_9GAMM|nr:MAG: hypothetical protein BECKUNK1418G_GA0071005_101035 [Candidatus Kentron sp. UNK]VFK68377.1 MAG: hypothetical protein BECKUNK1418H_GA0071006_10021 [Candidatus Kentron sp. UNK]